jgi:hypothetical protein
MNLEISSQLWTVANTHGHSGLELEFRLGHALAQFTPNVGKPQFCKLKETLDASSAFKKMDIETIEKIGEVKHVTTLSILDDNIPNPPPPSFCMTKTKVSQVEYPCENSPYTMRVSMALERIVPLVPVRARLTRHKKRRRYIRKGWAIDLTEVVSNGDVDTEESFEVEIELLDTGLLFEKTMEYVVDYGLMLVKDVVKMLHA